MAISSANAAAAAKTRRVETLTSGTSWTVPTDVTYVVATLIGAGGGGGGSYNTNPNGDGYGGQKIITTLTTTPGASITYAIGAGGAGGTFGSSSTFGSAGGSTTFTGATTAVGGNGGNNSSGGPNTGTSADVALNGGYGRGQNINGGTGGNGAIYLEYFLQEMTMKKFAVIENNKVINIVVGVEEEVVMAHPNIFIEYTDGNWDHNNGIDGGDFFPVPVTE